MVYGIFNSFLDVEELAESKKLEHFINLRLNIEENHVSVLRFYKLEECSERPDTCRRNVIQVGTVEDNVYKVCGYNLVDLFLEIY